MTNRIALVLGFFILVGVVVDVMVYETANLLFLAKKFAELIEWIAFWR